MYVTESMYTNYYVYVYYNITVAMHNVILRTNVRKLHASMLWYYHYREPLSETLTYTHIDRRFGNYQVFGEF